MGSSNSKSSTHPIPKEQKVMISQEAQNQSSGDGRIKPTKESVSGVELSLEKLKAILDSPCL